MADTTIPCIYWAKIMPAFHVKSKFNRNGNMSLWSFFSLKLFIFSILERGENATTPQQRHAPHHTPGHQHTHQHTHHHTHHRRGASSATPAGPVSLFTRAFCAVYFPRTGLVGHWFAHILTLAALSKLQLLLFFWGDFYGQNLRN